MSFTSLAPELTDSIVDFLHDDPTSLKSLSTTCRRFLPACRFHLFSELALESEKLRGKNFPASLTPLVRHLQLSPGLPAVGGFTAFPFFTSGTFSIPPPPLTGPQLRQCIHGIRSPNVQLKGVKVATDHALFTAVATSDLKHDTTSLSLNGCCVDSDDLVTLSYALPRVKALHISALTFDKSRAMIRKVERAAPVPMGFFVPFASSTSDWSSFTESMASTIKARRLHLEEITIEETRWTNELCENLVDLVERIDESTKLTLRVQLPEVPSQAMQGETPIGQDPIDEQLVLFARFLEICGAKIDRLDVRLGNAAVYDLSPTKQNMSTVSTVERGNGVNGEAASPNVGGGVVLAVDTTLGSIREYCPRLEALRLSGSLCSTDIMKQVIQGVKLAPEHSSPLRVLGLGPVGAGVSWSDVSHVLGIVGAGLESVVIAEGDMRVIPADARGLALEKFAELANRGLHVVFAENPKVGDF